MRAVLFLRKGGGVVEALIAGVEATLMIYINSHSLGWADPSTAKSRLQQKNWVLGWQEKSNPM